MHSLTIYIISSFSLMFAMSEFASRIRGRTKRRTRELDQVEKLLIDHYDALERVFDDPATPPEMNEILLWLSDSISKRERAAFIVEEVFNGKPSSAADMHPDYRALCVSRPDLVKDIDRAISTGFAALILRWPETARRFEFFMSEIMRRDRDRDIARAVRRAESCDAEVGTVGALATV